MVTPSALPAAFTSGQVLTASDQNLIRGAFRILQVVAGTPTNTQATFTTNTPGTTGITATITPLYNTSKILIISSIGGVNKQSSDTGLDLWIYKNGSVLVKTGSSVCKDGTINQANTHASALYLDSPATTSATTYAIFGASVSNSSFAISQHQSAYSTIILCEVSA